MDATSILMILAITSLVGWFIAQPLFHKDVIKTTTLKREHSILLAERERILTALQELEADNALGKIPEEDYPNRRESLMKRGVDVLKRLQEFTIEESRFHLADDHVNSSNERRERVKLDDDLESLIALRRREKTQKAGGFCPQCGGSVMEDDSFCTSCGEDLNGK